jgi:two-component system chemotaxis sensor kinase CheA
VDLEFLTIFLDEAVEILQKWESSCLSLEKNKDLETINELFRSAHNLKGSSKSVGLDAFAQFVHAAEDLITRVKNAQIACDPDVIAVLLDTQKALGDWVDQLRVNVDFVPDTNAICERLKNVQMNVGQVLASESSKATDLGSILVQSGQVTQIQVEQAVNLQNRKLGEVLVDQGVVTPDVVQDALKQQRAAVGQKPDDTIRVSLRKLDSMIRLIGELSIQHSIVRNARDTRKLSESASLDAIALAHKVIQDLQTEAMSLRMQPLENLFQRLERVSRDVARQQQKTINVLVKGTDVELDKTVLERMKDPLIHILRNAVDHGIETAEKRASCGKSPAATVLIEGIQTAANVTIRITDDGQGLNEERILAKAKERQLVPQDANPSRSEIHQMIFMPGFSTVEQVTDVSGRGVGMDVVKRAVDDLGGHIVILSEPGRGTQFQITLPSTLSILDAIVVGLDNVHYAVPVQDVEEVIDLSTATIESSTQRGQVINLRGRILPIQSLNEYLPHAPTENRKPQNVAIVARHDAVTVAFQVDSIAGQQSIVVRQLEGNLAKVPGFAGGTILASGEPSMIIHLQQIVRSYVSGVK